MEDVNKLVFIVLDRDFHLVRHEDVYYWLAICADVQELKCHCREKNIPKAECNKGLCDIFSWFSLVYTLHKLKKSRSFTFHRKTLLFRWLLLLYFNRNLYNCAEGPLDVGPKVNTEERKGTSKKPQLAYVLTFII